MAAVGGGRLARGAGHGSDGPSSSLSGSAAAAATTVGGEDAPAGCFLRKLPQSRPTSPPPAEAAGRLPAGDAPLGAGVADASAKLTRLRPRKGSADAEGGVVPGPSNAAAHEQREAACVARRAVVRLACVVREARTTRGGCQQTGAAPIPPHAPPILALSRA